MECQQGFEPCSSALQKGQKRQIGRQELIEIIPVFVSGNCFLKTSAKEKSDQEASLYMIYFECILVYNFKNKYIYIYLYIYTVLFAHFSTYTFKCLHCLFHSIILFFLFAIILLHQLTFPPDDQGTLEFPPGVTERFVEIECHDCLSGGVLGFSKIKIGLQGMSSGDILKQYLESVCTRSVLPCFSIIIIYCSFFDVVHRHLILQKCDVLRIHSC